VADLTVHIGRHIHQELVPVVLTETVFFVRAMVFNATFNNISVILWRSVLLVEETGVPGENHRPAARH
jgi:hypothetical protein